MLNLSVVIPILRESQNIKNLSEDIINNLTVHDMKFYSLTITQMTVVKKF